MRDKKNILMVLAVIVLSIGIVFFMAGTESRVGQQLRDGGEERTATHDPNDAELERELKITVSGTREQFNHLQQLSATLKSMYAKLSIEIVLDETYAQDSDEFIEQLKKEIAMGESADVLLVNNRVAAKLAAEGYVLTLDGWVPTGAYHPALLETVRWNGLVWGLPWTADPYVLAWHPDGLESAGFSGLPETIYDLRIMQERFKEQEKSLVYVDPSDPQAAFALLNVWDEGLAYAFTEEAESDSLEKSEAIDPESAWTLLKNGDLAMYITRASALTEEHEQDGVQIEPLNWLNIDGEAQQEAGWISGTSFVIVATTNLKQEALEWIEQAALSEWSRELLRTGQSFERRPFEAKLRQAMTAGESSSFVAPTGAAWDQFAELFQQYWAKKITADEVLSSYHDWFEQAQP